MNLALGRVKENPFNEKDIMYLKHEVLAKLEQTGLELKLEADDWRDVPTDFRYVDLQLWAVEDPSSRIGTVLTRSPRGTLGQDAAPPRTSLPEEKWMVSGADRPLELPRRRSRLSRVIMAFQLSVAE